MSVTRELKLPEGLKDSLGPGYDLGESAKQWLVIGLFLESRISSGKAAEFLGIGKLDFMDLLNEKQLPYLVGNEETLREEQKAARATGERS